MPFSVLLNSNLKWRNAFASDIDILWLFTLLQCLHPRQQLQTPIMHCLDLDTAIVVGGIMPGDQNDHKE